MAQNAAFGIAAHDCRSGSRWRNRRLGRCRLTELRRGLDRPRAAEQAGRPDLWCGLAAARGADLALLLKLLLLALQAAAPGEPMTRLVLRGRRNPLVHWRTRLGEAHGAMEIRRLHRTIGRLEVERIALDRLQRAAVRHRDPAAGPFSGRFEALALLAAPPPGPSGPDGARPATWGAVIGRPMFSRHVHSGMLPIFWSANVSAALRAVRPAVRPEIEPGVLSPSLPPRRYLLAWRRRSTSRHADGRRCPRPRARSGAPPWRGLKQSVTMPRKMSLTAPGWPPISSPASASIGFGRLHVLAGRA